MFLVSETLVLQNEIQKAYGVTVPLWVARGAIIVRQVANVALQVLVRYVQVAVQVHEATSEISKQFRIPAIVWGVDLPQTTLHTTRALAGFGFTVNNSQGNFTKPVSPVHVRGDNKNPGNRRWYKDYAPCKGESSTTVFCDEFPYFSTIISGEDSYLNGDVSIYPVSASEQRGRGGQGPLLNSFYGKSKGADVPKYKTDAESPSKSIFLTSVSPAFPTYWIDRSGLPHPFL